MDLVILFVSAAIVNNFVLTQFLGICPFVGVSKKIESALGMGLAVIFVITLASAVAFFAFRFILVPLNLEYLHIILFIIIVASLVQFIELFLKKSSPSLYNALGAYLPLISTNCAIMGAILLNMNNDHNFISSVIFSLGAGVGFLIAIVIFAGIRERLELNNVPKIFQGFPIALVAAGLMSIAFLGFTGLLQ